MIDIGKYIYYNKTRHLRKSYFLRALGIKAKSYVGQILLRIHDYYFLNEQSLKKDFKKYYRKEFGTFKIYLDKKHNLFNNEIEKLNYKSSYYSEKQLSERHNVGELLSDIYENNILNEKVMNILCIENLDEVKDFES